MKIQKYMLIIFIIAISVGTAFGQHKSREKLKAMHVAFITQKLELTTTESQEFWPLYNEYRQDLKDLENKYELQKPESEITAVDAQGMLAQLEEYRTKENEIKEAYNDNLKNILPPVKIVKLHFAEIEFREEILRDLRKRYKERQDDH